MDKRGKIFPWKFFLVFSLILLSLNYYVSAEELNLTDYNKSVYCLQNSEDIMEELSLANFSILRVNDSIKEAKNIFEIQEAIAEKGRVADYSNVLTICEEIVSIRGLAFDLRDQIRVLMDFYNDSSQGIDSSEIELLFVEIDKEMDSERYELVPGLIEKTYSEIILAQSRATTMNVFYDATTRGLKRFVTESWKELIGGLAIFLILILILKKPFQKWILRRDLMKVEIRKRSLKDMITKNQDRYFNKGKMSEESFTIKNKKLAELIRDVDRQISLIKEQLYALDHKHTIKKELKKK